MSIVVARSHRNIDLTRIEHDSKIIDQYMKPYKQDNWSYYDIKIAGFLSGQLQRIQGEDSANSTNYFCNKLFGCGYGQIKAQKEVFFDEGKLVGKIFIQNLLKIVLFWRMESLRDKIKEIPAKSPNNTRSENRLQQIKNSYKTYKRECFTDACHSTISIIEASPIILVNPHFMFQF